MITKGYNMLDLILFGLSIWIGAALVVAILAKLMLGLAYLVRKTNNKGQVFTDFALLSFCIFTVVFIVKIIQVFA